MSTKVQGGKVVQAVGRLPAHQRVHVRVVRSSYHLISPPRPSATTAEQSTEPHAEFSNSMRRQTASWHRLQDAQQTRQPQQVQGEHPSVRPDALSMQLHYPNDDQYSLHNSHIFHNHTVNAAPLLRRLSMRQGPHSLAASPCNLMSAGASALQASTELGEQLRGAHDWRDVARIVSIHGDSMNGVHLSHAMSRLARLGPLDAAAMKALHQQQMLHRQRPAQRHTDQQDVPVSSELDLWSLLLRLEVLLLVQLTGQSSSHDSTQPEHNPPSSSSVHPPSLSPVAQPSHMHPSESDMSASSGQLLTAAAVAGLLAVGGRVLPMHSQQHQLVHLQQPVPLLRPRQFATVISCFAKLSHQPSSVWVDTFLAASKPRLPWFRTQELSMLLWGVAKLLIQPSGVWLDAFCRASAKRAQQCEPQEMATIVWGLATLKHAPPKAWLQLWVVAAQANFSRCSAYDLSQLTWGLAKLGHLPGGMVHPSQASQDVLPGMGSSGSHRSDGSQDATRSAGSPVSPHDGQSIGTLPGKTSQPANASLPTVEGSSQGLANDGSFGSTSASGTSCDHINSSRAAVVGGAQGHAWLCSLLKHAAIKLPNSGQPQDVANLLWGLATAHAHPGAAWLNGLLDALLASNVWVRSFQPTDTASMLWALATLGHCPANPRVLDAVLEGLLVLKPADPSCCSGSVHVQQHRTHNASSGMPEGRFGNETGCDSEAKPGVRCSSSVGGDVEHWQQQSCLPARPVQPCLHEPTRHVRPHLVLHPDCSQQELSNILWALARLQYMPHQSVLSRLLSAVSRSLPTLGAQATTLFLWSCLRLRIQLRQPLLLRIVRCTAAQVEVFEPRGAALVLYSLMRHNYSPSPQLVGRILQHMGMRISAAGGCHPQTLSMLLWTLGKLRFRPPLPWLRSLLVHTVQLLPSCSVQEQLNMLWGLSAIGYRPDELWLTLLLSSIRRSLPLYAAHSLHVLTYSLCRLKAAPGASLMDSLRMEVAARPQLLQQHPRMRKQLEWLQNVQKLSDARAAAQAAHAKVSGSAHGCATELSSTGNGWPSGDSVCSDVSVSGNGSAGCFLLQVL